jgi:hypothetical protein
MLGRLIPGLDDPGMASRLIATLDMPGLQERLEEAAGKSGQSPEATLAALLRHFLDHADDERWTRLIGVMNSAEDPTLAALRAILQDGL